LFPDHGVVVAAASNISPTDGVDSTGRKIAEVFIKPTTDK
jgi:hypothetical protein